MVWPDSRVLCEACPCPTGNGLGNAKSACPFPESALFDKLSRLKGVHWKGLLAKAAQRLGEILAAAARFLTERR